MTLFDRYSRGPLMDPVKAIAGGGSLVGGILQGVIGSSASKKAGQLQHDAAITAGDKLLNTATAVQPQIGNSAAAAAGAVSGASGMSADKVENAVADAQKGVTGAGKSANDLLNPYIGAGADALGTMKGLLKPGGSADILSMDPGYQFRLDQAKKAMVASQAANGSALGGGAARALDRYSQDYASGEFGNVFNRLNTVAGMGLGASGQAGKNLIDTSESAGQLGLTGATTAGSMRIGGAEYGGSLGYDAAKSQAGISMDAAKGFGDYLTGGAAAKAAGTVGSANAWNGGIGSATGNISNMLLLQQLLKNPTGKQAAPVASTYDGT